MGDDLFRCGIGIHMSISIAIGRVVCVNTYLIVVALSIEAKPTNECSYSVVLWLELESVFNVAKV